MELAHYRIVGVCGLRHFSLGGLLIAVSPERVGLRHECVSGIHLDGVSGNPKRIVKRTDEGLAPVPRQPFAW
jgi:hypothetical protein